MDLIKQMTQRRAALGITTNAIPETKAEQIRVMQKQKTLRQRRQEIIDSKPKPKVVLDYLEDLIQANLESSDEDGD